MSAKEYKAKRLLKVSKDYWLGRVHENMGNVSKQELLAKEISQKIKEENHSTIEDVKRVSKKLSYNHINAEMDTDENKIINYLELSTELEKLKI